MKGLAHGNEMPGGQKDSNERVGSVGALVFGRTGLESEESQGVIRERPVTLYLNGREIVTLLCAGHHLDELAVGFFRSEGFLTALEDVRNIEIDEIGGKVDIAAKETSSLADQMWMKRTITSGCGKGSLFYYSLDALMSRRVKSTVQVSPRQVIERVEDLNRLSEVYRLTHGVHNTLLADPDGGLLFRDDIGRHNAVDMIIGHAMLKRISLKDKLLVMTGRLTSEILIKSAKVGIPILISRNTATTLAIELAESLNITLIGYARAGKFSLYTGRQRISQ